MINISFSRNWHGYSMGEVAGVEDHLAHHLIKNDVAWLTDEEPADVVVPVSKPVVNRKRPSRRKRKE